MTAAAPVQTATTAFFGSERTKAKAIARDGIVMPVLYPKVFGLPQWFGWLVSAITVGETEEVGCAIRDALIAAVDPRTDVDACELDMNSLRTALLREEVSDLTEWVFHRADVGACVMATVEWMAGVLDGTAALDNPPEPPHRGERSPVETAALTAAQFAVMATQAAFSPAPDRSARSAELAAQARGELALARVLAGCGAREFEQIIGDSTPHPVPEAVTARYRRAAIAAALGSETKMLFFALRLNGRIH